MTVLLTLQDFIEYRGMTANINFDKELKQHVLDAQEFELRIFMGESFYLALEDDFNQAPSLPTYTDLFDSVKYTYNNEEYENPGIKRLLVQYAYSRYVAESGSTSTAYGLMQKNHNHSTPTDAKVTGRISAKARSGATSYEDRIKLYLDRNSGDYPLWKCAKKKRTVGGGFKISAIG